MIRYSLTCDNHHGFDGWFASSSAFDTQRQRGLLTCPSCGVDKVQKALMSPSVAPSDKARFTAGQSDAAEVRKVLQAWRKKVTSEAENVGDRFAEEARRIHFNDAPERGIYGEASRDEVAGLIEDGVNFLPLPSLPDDLN